MKLLQRIACAIGFHDWDGHTESEYPRPRCRRCGQWHAPRSVVQKNIVAGGDVCAGDMFGLPQTKQRVTMPPVKPPRNQMAAHRYRNDARFHAAVTSLVVMGYGPDDAHQMADALEALLVPLDPAKVADSTSAKLTAAQRAAERGAAREVVAPATSSEG